VPPSLVYSTLAELRDAVGEVEGAAVDHTDGVKILWPDGWVHVRASNTQSLIRIIAEADGARRAQELLDWARERLKA
jgi:phosphomannomutase